MKMSAKLWAQRRNFGKYRIHGALGTLDGLYLGQGVVVTQGEAEKLKQATAILAEIVEEWEKNNLGSKRLYTKEA